MQKVFNGQTRFKIGAKSILVGNIVMDDAHACVDSIRDACVIKLDKSEQAYRDIVNLFASALENQGAGTFSDIKSASYDALLPVPYWVWQERQNEVIEILAKITQRPSNPQETPHNAFFAWPLIKDSLGYCQCIVSGQSLEIAPYLPPLDSFGSYFNARHRVFMSATVTNDSFLVRGLRLAPKTIQNPLVFKDEKWSGEKMILLPSLIDRTLDREAIVNFFGKPAPGRKFGVVALTPSFNVAEFWKTCGATVATKETIDNEVNQLRSGNCEKTLAIASRYDGIDLPDASCRVLIFDSLPNASNLIDAYADNCRGTSSINVMRVARSIEQGLGRSVRGEKDYCAIVIVGPELVRMVRSQHTKSFFSPQTRAQIDIGLEVAELAKAETAKTPLEALKEVANQCLKRDAGWKQFYVEQMDQTGIASSDNKALDIFAHELDAEQAFQAGDPHKAVKIIQHLIDNQVTDVGEKGWYLQEMARYALAYSKGESNSFQLEAHKKNRYVMRPPNGMIIEKISIVSQKRVANVIEWIKAHGGQEELRLAVEDILGRLEFGVKADRFESGMLEIGTALGFASQRPDKEWKEGPDNLWAVRDGEYFLIEGKSEVNLQRSEIHKEESGQMNNSCAWFDKNYKGATVTRILVIPTKKVGKAAGFNQEVIILRPTGLRRFTKAVREFFKEFANFDLHDLSEAKVQELIDSHSLTVEGIRGHCEGPSN